MSEAKNKELGAKAVIEIGKQAAKKSGYQLEDFKEPKVTKDRMQRKLKWTLYYEGKIAVPGGHFIVIIDDTTKKAEVLPGE